MRPAYYNEIDPFAAQWLRNLIEAGHIAKGEVDERSIVDVRPDDLRGFGQCHFFAGIGVWSHALRRAGWGDERPVWTGSCPCQPFSAAGQGNGFADERHLWPAFHHLIRECRPGVVFGEQVASADGLAWLDLVQTDLEATLYASGTVDFCAAGVGSPNIRQRLWWVGYDRMADTTELGRFGRRAGQAGDESGAVKRPERLCDAGRMGNASGTGLPARERLAVVGAGWREEGRAIEQPGGSSGWLAHPVIVGRGEGRSSVTGQESWDAFAQQRSGIGWSHDAFANPGPTNGLWRDADWLRCTDGKWRAVEPGTFPLAHGASSRVGRLRAYGNAINAEVAAQVIRAAMPSLPA